MFQLGAIGTGKMGGALLNGVLSAKLLKPGAITAYDTDSETLKRCHKKFAIRTSKNLESLLNQSERILLAVKPQDLEPVLALAKRLPHKPKTVISICAGVPMAKLRAAFGPKTQICRAMPNTPAVLLSAATAITCSSNMKPAEKKWLLNFFSSVGYVCEVKEPLLNAITGLSGSGPAYSYYIMEALAQAGAAQGLPYADALGLAAKTMEGAAKMILMGEKPVTQLIADVTSKGGTTFAGMQVLTSSQISKILKHTVAAATQRAGELAALS